MSATTTTGYDAVGNVQTVDGPLANDTTTLFYNGAREYTGEIGPDPDGTGPLKNRVVLLHYDATDQVDSVSLGTATDSAGNNYAALQIAELARDAAGRVTGRLLYDGGSTLHAVTQYGYDKAGRLQCTAERMNPAAFGALPSSACTLGTPGSYGPDRITHVIHEYAGLVDTITTGYGTALQRDAIKYVHTLDGEVATIRDANGNVTTYGYDGFDRLVTTNYPSTTKGAGTSSASDYEQLTLDADGNVTSRRLRDGRSIGYTYDALDRAVARRLTRGSR